MFTACHIATHSAQVLTNQSVSCQVKTPRNRNYCYRQRNQKLYATNNSIHRYTFIALILYVEQGCGHDSAALGEADSNADGSTSLGAPPLQPTPLNVVPPTCSETLTSHTSDSSASNILTPAAHTPITIVIDESGPVDEHGIYNQDWVKKNKIYWSTKPEGFSCSATKKIAAGLGEETVQLCRVRNSIGELGYNETPVDSSQEPIFRGDDARDSVVDNFEKYTEKGGGEIEKSGSASGSSSTGVANIGNGDGGADAMSDGIGGMDVRGGTSSTDETVDILPEVLAQAGSACHGGTGSNRNLFIRKNDDVKNCFNPLSGHSIEPLGGSLWMAFYTNANHLSQASVKMWGKGKAGFMLPLGLGVDPRAYVIVKPDRVSFDAVPASQGTELLYLANAVLPANIVDFERRRHEGSATSSCNLRGGARKLFRDSLGATPSGEVLYIANLFLAADVEGGVIRPVVGKILVFGILVGNLNGSLESATIEPLPGDAASRVRVLNYNYVAPLEDTTGFLTPELRKNVSPEMLKWYQNPYINNDTTHVYLDKSGVTGKGVKVDYALQITEPAPKKQEAPKQSSRDRRASESRTNANALVPIAQKTAVSGSTENPIENAPRSKRKARESIGGDSGSRTPAGDVTPDVTSESAGAALSSFSSKRAAAADYVPAAKYAALSESHQEAKSKVLALEASNRITLTSHQTEVSLTARAVAAEARVDSMGSQLALMERAVSAEGEAKGLRMVVQIYANQIKMDALRGEKEIQQIQHAQALGFAQGACMLSSMGAPSAMFPGAGGTSVGPQPASYSPALLKASASPPSRLALTQEPPSIPLGSINAPSAQPTKSRLHRLGEFKELEESGVLSADEYESELDRVVRDPEPVLTKFERMKELGAMKNAGLLNDENFPRFKQFLLSLAD